MQRAAFTGMLTLELSHARNSNVLGQPCWEDAQAAWTDTKLEVPLSPVFEPSSPDPRLVRKLTIQSLLTEPLCPLGLLDEDLDITKQRQAVPAALSLTF